MSEAPHVAGRRAATLLCLLALLAGPASPQPPEESRVRVRLQPDVVGAGEVVRLAITVDTTGLSPSAIRQPRFELENLEIVGGPSRRESFSMVNGRATRTRTLIWFLRAGEPGSARVHDLSVGIGEREISLPEQTLRVTEEPREPEARERARRPGSPEDLLRRFFGPTPRRPRTIPDGPPEVRLEASVRPESPFRGQQTLYHLDLLVERRRPGQGRIRVESIFPRGLPDFHGFWSEEIPVPDQVRPEVAEIDGRLFWRRPILRRALYPLRSGKLVIDPAALELRALYYRPTVFGEEPEPTRRLELEGNPVIVEAASLPPAPPGFDGPVGKFELHRDLRPVELEAGSAATLVVRIEGTGHLGGIPDPELPKLSGLEIYPPAERAAREVRSGRIHESRTWTWTLVPDRGGEWTLPPLEWTYFDPREAIYRTLSSQPHSLMATGSTGSLPVAEIPSSAPDAPRTEEEPESTAGHSLLEPRLRDRILFTLVAALAVVGLGALALLGYRLLPRGGSSGRRLLARLRSLPEDQPRQAATAAEEAWREYLRNRWHLPEGAPTRSWEETLREQGMDPEIIRDLVSLMGDLHYLRYAPQLAASGALQEDLLPRSRKILRRLG